MRNVHGWTLAIFCSLALGFAVTLLPTTPLAAASAAENERSTKRLFQAVQANDLPGVQASVDAGADVTARDHWGMTPADIAIDRGHFRIAHFLVSVRNLRRAQESQAQTSDLQPQAAKVPIPLAESSPRSTTATPASATDSQLDSRPRPGGPLPAATWPAGKPHPFDPSTPAPGSQLYAPPAATGTR